MKIGILRESNTPPDKRVPLTPEQCAEVQEKFDNVSIIVQPSLFRCFSDDEYKSKGLIVDEDINDCDILFGVKEVEINNFIPGKIYLFFSHTIKKQEHNRKLLQAVLERKIQLVDYEALTDKHGFRIIGFGRFAGLVGAYNGLRAYGLRNKLFDLNPAYLCFDIIEMLRELDTIKLPQVKIAVTGDGRVASGVLEIMKRLNIEKVEPAEYILKTYTEPVFTQLIPQNYVRRKDFEPFDLLHFFNHPDEYENVFLPFARTTDLLIASAFWNPRSPVLFTASDMKENGFRISVISDITCDIVGSIPSTKKASTIDDPFYDYNPETGELEPAFSSLANISVQAVDNLPCELPKDASEDFGRNLIDKVLPAFLENDPDEIIERASITKNGKLTPRFSYLQDFANGK